MCTGINFTQSVVLHGVNLSPWMYLLQATSKSIIILVAIFSLSGYMNSELGTWNQQHFMSIRQAWYVYIIEHKSVYYKVTSKE